MENAIGTKRRLSILKKRRSRSVSPTKSPPFERRTSRRISFSGKHAVREFFIGGENKETIWGESYEESTEHHTINSEQLSRQQQTLRSNRTKNETIYSLEAMECTNDLISASSMASASIAISSTFFQDRALRGNNSMEKENVFHSPASKVRAVEKPANLSTGDPKSKIKLFQSLREKNVSTSDTIHQSKDISVDMSAIASSKRTTFSTHNMSTQNDNVHFSPPFRQMDETNVNNADMSIMPSQIHRSVICKSPSKRVAINHRRNQTVNFANDTMDVTVCDKDVNNLQESRYPLNGTSIEPIQLEMSPKRAAVTNPYLKLFLGGSSTTSDCEKDEMQTDAPAKPSLIENVIAHETMPIDVSSIPLDHSTGAEFIEYPFPSRNATTNEATAVIPDPIHSTAKNATICEQFSIDKSLGFSSLNPVVQMHDDKENVFVVAVPAPAKQPTALDERDAFSVQKNDAAATENLLSDTINTTVFNLHRNEIVNSTNRSMEFSSRPSIDASLDVDVTPPIPQLPNRQTIYCNQSLRNEMSHISVVGNESIEISPIVQMPPPVENVVSKQRRVTCSQPSPMDESNIFDNIVQTSESPNIAAAAAPINTTIHDGQINLCTPVATIKHNQNVARRKTTVFNNDPISADTILNTLPPSALSSYHHLTMEQTQIASRDTSSISSRPLVVAHHLPYNDSNRVAFDEYCQLTFLDEDIENICDTKMDLVDSEIHEQDDCVIEEQSMDASVLINKNRLTRDALPMHSINIENSLKMPTPLASHSNRSSAFDMSIGTSRISLASPLPITVNEQHPFKASSLLERSDAEMHNVPTPSTAVCLNRNDQNRPAHVLQCSPSIHNSTNEESYLHNVTVDKKVKDLRLDFSGYEKFKGLATPNDVCNAFVQRCELFKQKIHQMKEIAKTKNVPDPESQNLEAPSSKFLFMNKMKMLEEENAAKLEKEFDEEPVGAIVPIIPSLLVLIKNKCKELRYWKFETLWFYQGRLILRHKILQSYIFVLDFDPEQKAVDDHINLYGKLMFNRARSMQCPIWLPRLRPVDRLRLQTTIASEPINLLQMCRSSNDLSDFDEKMHAIVRDACNKVTKIALAAIEANAIFMMENDIVYIHYPFDDRDHKRFVICNIKLNDIERTGPENVQTVPIRSLHNDLNAPPRGAEFIHEFFRNAHKYLSEQ